LGLFLGVLILFLNTNKSFADSFITNTDDYSAGIMWQIKNYCYQHAAEDLIQPFFISSNIKVNSVGFYGYSYGQANNFKLIVSSINPDFKDSNNHYSDIAPYILADVNFTLPNSVNYVQIDLSNYNISLNYDGYLYFWFMSLDNSGYCVKGGLYGRNGSDYNSPSAVLGGNYSSSNDITGRQSYFFNAWYGGDMVKLDLYTSPLIPPAFINIIKPQNQTVITNQASTTPPYRFDFWGVDYYLPDAATGTTATLFLDYSSFPDDKIKYQEQFINLPIDDYTISTSTQFYFGKTYFLPNGDYKAKAYMQYRLAGTTTQTIIYSDDVFFSISELGGISYSTSTTSTIPIPNFEDICTPPQGGFLDYPTQNITYALCKVFSYLFVPNQEQQQNIQNRFSSFQDIIKSKPPLGYFYKIKDALNQNITAGNATTTQVLNTSTTQAFSTVFSPLKTGLGWILWLAAGSWVFIKIKNLNI
jgi:hypothetical protein